MLEERVENHLRERVRAVRVNGVSGLCEKHVSPGQSGVPDDLVTWPWAVMRLVETKKPKKGAEAHQARDHARRAKRGIPVAVLDTIEKVDAWVDSECAGHV